MNAHAALPRLDELPIPKDVQPGKGWTEQMLEMADHIGAYRTLLIISALGGREIYVPRSIESSPFADIVDGEAIVRLARIYGGGRVQLPVGRTALSVARRAGIIAAVRAGEMTGSQAQKILRTSRTYVSHLVNHADEAQNATPTRNLFPRDTRQLDMFPNSEE